MIGLSLSMQWSESVTTAASIGCCQDAIACVQMVLDNIVELDATTEPFGCLPWG
jgi:hypothetical protein